MPLLWEDGAWTDYCKWQSEDKKTLKRINAIIKIGKPELLRGDLNGWWSRRIDDTNRIVYQVKGNDVIIAACKGHYE